MLGEQSHYFIPRGSTGKHNNFAKVIYSNHTFIIVLKKIAQPSYIFMGGFVMKKEVTVFFVFCIVVLCKFHINQSSFKGQCQAKKRIVSILNAFCHTKVTRMLLPYTSTATIARICNVISFQN